MIPRFTKNGYRQIIEWLTKEKFNFDPPASYTIKLDLGWVELPFVPLYEEKVLRTEGNYEIIQDLSGSKLKVFKGQEPFIDEFMPTYLQSAVSFWQKWEEDVKPRLDPTASGRYDGLEESCTQARKLRDKDQTFIVQTITGIYNYLRKLLGPEDVLYAFYDSPDMIRDMLNCWKKTD